jgi:hypothetical protein
MTAAMAACPGGTPHFLQIFDFFEVGPHSEAGGLAFSAELAEPCWCRRALKDPGLAGVGADDENGFCVLQVKANGHRNLVTVVGSRASVSAGEWVTAEGRWVQDREFGLHFRADMLNSTAPTTREGIEKYLGSRMVKGIGAVPVWRVWKVTLDESSPTRQTLVLWQR